MLELAEMIVEVLLWSHEHRMVAPRASIECFPDIVLHISMLANRTLVARTAVADKMKHEVGVHNNLNNDWLAVELTIQAVCNVWRCMKVVLPPWHSSWVLSSVHWHRQGLLFLIALTIDARYL